MNSSAGPPTADSSKTIFLIRHAESEENRRLGSLKSSVRAFSSFSLPTSIDLLASMELVNVSAQVDSPLSAIGRAQVAHMGGVLKKASFVDQLELVAHSPLQRARDTSWGMLQCRASTNAEAEMLNDSLSTSATVPAATRPRIVQLDLLIEKTPSEWLPGSYFKDSFQQRMVALEEWIKAQPETVICLVGHSQYFKALLHLDFKFGNCDVWRIQFQNDKDETKEEEDTGGGSDGKNTYEYDHALPPKWSKLVNVFTCPPPAEIDVEGRESNGDTKS